MAIHKKTFTKPVPAKAERVKVRGQPSVRWVSKGRTHTAILSEDQTRIVVESTKWYGTVNGRAVPLCRDKVASETMLRKLQADAALASVGIVDPFSTSKTRPLTEHLAEYHTHLAAKNNTLEYVSLTISRVRAVMDGCGFVTVADLQPSRVNEWLLGLQAPQAVMTIPSQESFTPNEAAALLGISGSAVRDHVKRHGLTATGNGKARRYPRATLVALANRRAEGVGPETVNHYVRAIRGFLRWMVRAKRIGSNPLDSLTLVATTVDTRRHRRELTIDELRRLLTTTRTNTRTYRGLTGVDRTMLYLVAATTGFRARALANLTVEDFQLAATPPTVTLAAKFNKSKRVKVQPLPQDVAAELVGYFANKPVGVPIWGGTWAKDHRGAEMLRGDLAAVGIPYVISSPDGPLYADFHALRHTMLTLGGRAGIDLRTLQELAGHSKPELTARYSHRRLEDLAGAMEKMPNFLAAPDATPSAPGSEQLTQLALSLLALAGTPATSGTSEQPGSGEQVLGGEKKEPLKTQGFDVIPSELWSLLFSEGDGTRTRNHRIDSPVL
jgi:integrase/recombinase XerC